MATYRLKSKLFAGGPTGGRPTPNPRRNNKPRYNNRRNNTPSQNPTYTTTTPGNSSSSSINIFLDGKKLNAGNPQTGNTTPPATPNVPTPDPQETRSGSGLGSFLGGTALGVGGTIAYGMQKAKKDDEEQQNQGYIQ